VAPLAPSAAFTDRPLPPDSADEPTEIIAWRPLSPRADALFDRDAPAPAAAEASAPASPVAPDVEPA
jgi:hypothetical protein